MVPSDTEECVLQEKREMKPQSAGGGGSVKTRYKLPYSCGQKGPAGGWQDIAQRRSCDAGTRPKEAESILGKEVLVSKRVPAVSQRPPGPFPKA